MLKRGPSPLETLDSYFWPVDRDGHWLGRQESQLTRRLPVSAFQTAIDARNVGVAIQVPVTRTCRTEKRYRGFLGDSIVSASILRGRSTVLGAQTTHRPATVLERFLSLLICE